MKRKNLFFASLIGVAVIGSLVEIGVNEGMFNNCSDCDDDSLTADINWAIENLEAGTFSEENSEIDEELVTEADIEYAREALKDYEDWYENYDDDNSSNDPVTLTPVVSKSCTACNGHGSVSCYECNGHGSQSCTLCSGAGYFSWNGESCHRCGGSGSRYCTSCDGTGTEECRTCDGKGRI